MSPTAQRVRASVRTKLDDALAFPVWRHHTHKPLPGVTPLHATSAFSRDSQQGASQTYAPSGTSRLSSRQPDFHCPGPRARHASGTKPAPAATQSLDPRAKTKVFMPPYVHCIPECRRATIATDISYRGHGQRDRRHTPLHALSASRPLPPLRKSGARIGAERDLGMNGCHASRMLRGRVGDERRRGKGRGIPSPTFLCGSRAAVHLFLLLRTKHKPASATATGESAAIRAEIYPSLTDIRQYSRAAVRSRQCTPCLTIDGLPADPRYRTTLRFSEQPGSREHL
ncbi:hypothetical protein B0H13DRAFT_2546285 [Mycena leptocephala]|nr:hypothetical protein B0H13DRAFT_2546285 [Mycena leptocephala]